ncbi:hypothetical protein DFJ74DRAFT_726025 [Hyaloraphidium curvatum]|nr:hypothetical protein DFJ74DRAFT_726025 [Hyaloraphidium curvatum]
MSVPFVPPVLPPGSPWRGLDAGRLVARVSNTVVNLETCHADFYGALDEPPAAAAPREANDAYVRALRYGHSVLAALLAPPGTDRGPLAEFCQNGAVPKDAVPEDLFAAIALAVFRRSFKTLRRCIAEFVDVGRRQRWGAFDPFGCVAGEPLPTKMPDNTKLYNDYFYDPAKLARQIAYTLARARPVRRRMADDWFYLDTLSLALLAAPEVFRAAYLGTLSRGLAQGEKLKEINKVAADLSDGWNALRLPVAENPRPWTEHRRRAERLGYFPCAAILAENLSIFADDCAKLGPESQAFARDVAQRTDALLRTLDLPRRPNPPDPKPMEDMERQLLLYGDLADACDACGKKSDGSFVMKRCARCRTARFCSRKCFAASWTSGSHPEVCYAAAPGWMPEMKAPSM